MDEKSWDLGRRMIREIDWLKRQLEEWEKKESPLTPFGSGGSFDPVPLCDKDAWGVYRRASIKTLERALEEAERKFKDL